MGIIKDLFVTPKMIGAWGEREIVNKLKLINPFGKNGKILRNIYIPKEDGSTAEIDVVYITTKGLFVIESKNFSGYIFGNETTEIGRLRYMRGKHGMGRRKLKSIAFIIPFGRTTPI